MASPEASLLIALIHNNSESRCPYIRGRIGELCGALRGNFAIQTLEVFFQPEPVPQTSWMSFARDLMKWRLERRWKQYRELPTRSWATDIKKLIRHCACMYLSGSGAQDLARAKQHSTLELAVADKHIRAWTQFMESGAEWMIVFEDDAVFREDSIRRLLDLLQDSSLRSSQHIYIDLSGGCPCDGIQVDRLETHRDASFRHFRKPVTNTTCTYLISRPLVGLLLEQVVRRPWLRLHQSDWLLNALFVRLEKQGLDCLCMHASPTIFSHGSVTGEYASTFDQGRY